MRHIPGIDKSEDGYTRVQRQVLALRRAGKMPYSDVADLTRWMRKPRTHDSVQEALEETARLYRKALWANTQAAVEIWLEKDALAGVIYPVTAEYDAPLMVTRGYSSETFCYEAIESREGDDRPYFIYYLGDLDRSGQDAARTLREKLERFAAEKGVNVVFEHLAIEANDIIELDKLHGRVCIDLLGEERWLSTREPKRMSAADKKWPFEFALELDAIEPDDLRALVRTAIEHHLPADQLRVLKVAEASERTLIRELVAGLDDAAP